MQKEDLPSPRPEGGSTEGWRADADELVALVRDAVQGDDGAFEQLYERTARWLLAEVRCLVPSAHSEDVLAETFLQAWRSLSTYDSRRGPPRAWLRAIARSRALDHLRREKVHAPAAPEDGNHKIALQEDPVGGPEQALSQAQQQGILRRSLRARRLSADEREVLSLAYFQDRTQQEIAVLMGVPLGTVKSMMSRAQGKLREEFAACARPLTGT